MKDQHGSVSSWMFRVSGEWFALAASVLVLVFVGWLFSVLDVYVFFGVLLLGLVYVRLQQAQYLGNGVRVHGKQFSDIYEIFRKQAAKLGVSKASLFIVQDPNLNAFALGVSSCTVVLTSALVEQMNRKELAFVMAHELGHYVAGHTKLSSFISPLGTNNYVSSLVFGFWLRKSEYTADRCGLIMTRDINSAISSMLKLSVGAILYKEMNMMGYVEQIAKSKHRLVAVSELLGDHPLLVNRIGHLMSFWEEDFKVGNRHEV